MTRQIAGIMWMGTAVVVFAVVVSLPVVAQERESALLEASERNAGAIDELRGLVQALTTQIEMLRLRIENVNGRFGLLDLMLTESRVECDSSPPPPCPVGWIDRNIRFQDAYTSGGPCGSGTQWRLCIRAAASPGP